MREEDGSAERVCERVGCGVRSYPVQLRHCCREIVKVLSLLGSILRSFDWPIAATSDYLLE